MGVSDLKAHIWPTFIGTDEAAVGVLPPVPSGYVKDPEGRKLWDMH